MSKNIVTLYKYTKLNQHLLDSIENNHIYLNDGKKFNDPYDAKEIKNDKKLHNIEGVHLICLTNSYRNRLMWAHYANSYRGVCLTIQVPREIVYPVCYSIYKLNKEKDIDIVISDSDYSHSKKMLKDNIKLASKKKKKLLIKDRIWKYEKEYRLIIEDNKEKSNYILEEIDGTYYVKCNITNVYIGLNVDKKSADYINLVKMCKKKSISIKYVELDIKKYKLVFKKLNN